MRRGLPQALRKVKPFALRSVQALGGYRLVRDSRWRSERLLILCYHGFAIADEHLFNPMMFFDGAHFERRLCAIRDGGFQVLPLSEAVDRVYRGTLPERAVCITIDDGCVDFYQVAYPLLRKYNFPATVYLTTYYSIHRRPVPISILLYVFWKSGAPLNLKAYGGPDQSFDLSDHEGRYAASLAVIKVFEDTAMSSESKQEYVARLANDLGVDLQPIIAKQMFHIMTGEQVADASRNEIEFELHTHRHRTPLDEDLFRREIRENRETIQSMTGRNPVHFCYPSGRHRPEFLPWLKDEGVISATTCDPGLASRQSEPLLIPRLVDTLPQSDAHFESWLSGFGSLLRQTGKAFR